MALTGLIIYVCHLLVIVLFNKFPYIGYIYMFLSWEGTGTCTMYIHYIDVLPKVIVCSFIAMFSSIR